MNNFPFYSVIIPTFNRRDFLKKSVDSVLAQTFEDFELIIVDDGSNDQTRELINETEDPRLQYYYQDNHGVAFSRNIGLNHARGTFIAYLDSDDRWVESKLEKFRQTIEEFPEIKIFHSEERWIRQGKVVHPDKKQKKPDGEVYRNVLPICCISISTAVIHRDVFLKVGVFDESLEACEDYDFWLRSTAQFPVKLIPEYLTEKDGGRADQLSTSVWGLDRFRIKALSKMLASGNLNREDCEATLAEMKKKVSIFVKGAKKRGREEEIAYYQNLCAKYQSG